MAQIYQNRNNRGPDQGGAGGVEGGVAGVPEEGAGSGDGTNKSERKTPRNKRLPLLDPDWEDVVLEVQSELPGLEDSANPTSAGARAGGAGLSSPGKSPAPKLGGKGGVGRPAGVSGGSAGARSVGGPLQPKVRRCPKPRYTGPDPPPCKEGPAATAAVSTGVLKRPAPTSLAADAKKLQEFCTVGGESKHLADENM